MSKFVSRKRSVRDSGNAAAETFATSLDCDNILKSDPRPTTATSSPGSSVLLTNVALLTGVSPISFGSYETTARLCSGWMYSTRPGISSEPANVNRTSPMAMGTVLRSTTTQPRAASAMSPVP